MSGKELKEILKDMGYNNISELSRQMNIGVQNLHKAFDVQDVKTGLLEDIAKALNIPVADFYPINSAKADNGIAVSGGSVESPVVNNAISESLVQSMLDTKDEQIDRLLGIIETK